MAALVERSPCAASRGGSTTKRPRSKSRGSSPAATRFSSIAATRDWKSAKTFILPSRSLRWARLTQLRRPVKKPGMFMDRKTVGHAGDVVGDGAGPFALPRLRRPVAGHSRGIGQIGFEQPSHDGVRLVAHPL